MSGTCAVLVVEDEAIVRAVLAEVLSLEGFDVRSAADGRDALAVLEHWCPNLILMDLNMPRMDGWAFLEELRRRPDLADIPVIVLSAALRDKDRLNRLHAVDVLPKPSDLDMLIGAIRRALGTVTPESLEELAPLPVQEGTAGVPMTESSRPSGPRRSGRK
jgi:CheY-like chemotaxis protein